MRTTPVDARARADGGSDSSPRVIAEWLAPPDRSESPGAVSRREFGEVIERARQSAERAVDDRAVPRRYDPVLKRYFDRLPKKLLPAAAPAPDPSSPAPTIK